MMEQEGQKVGVSVEEWSDGVISLRCGLSQVPIQHVLHNREAVEIAANALWYEAPEDAKDAFVEGVMQAYDAWYGANRGRKRPVF